MREFDPDRRREEARRAERAEKLKSEQFRAEFLTVMNMPEARSILHLFMQDMGLDDSAFATNAMAQSHAIGKQDAARWWLDWIRKFCPEKEGRMREEARARLRVIEAGSTDDEDDDE